ncbi:MAG TPA: hypothetical protein VEC12_05070 [Bacteroidia bacterium]|nr:hypothetical protein [Bacteroidia bacterium]
MKYKYVFIAAQVFWLLAIVTGVVTVMNNKEDWPLLMWIFGGISLVLTVAGILLRLSARKKNPRTPSA